MHRARIALVLVPLLLSAALIGTVVATYLSVREVLVTLVRGQGDAILDSLSHHPSELSDDYLESILREQGPEGLRCIAIFNPGDEVVRVLGDCLPQGGEALRRALLEARSHEVVEVGGRVRMVRGGNQPRRWPVLVEFEPIMRRDLEQGALRSLGAGGAASLALVLVALGLWRFSLREERLKAAMERDRRLAALGEMAGVLAHEIRNPLASMKGHAQLLAERLEPETPERQKADRVVGEALRLEELTADLLSFIRSKQIERREVDPRAVLEAAAGELGRGRVEVSVEGEVPDWPLDPSLLQQALTNLLRNALQASPQGASASASLAAENGSLVFRVRDRGEGVPEADLERIFEPFYTTRTRGTGLGLAVARRIVGLHGGTITAENHPEGGAVFQVRIPRG